MKAPPKFIVVELGNKVMLDEFDDLREATKFAEEWTEETGDSCYVAECRYRFNEVNKSKTSISSLHFQWTNDES